MIKPFSSLVVAVVVAVLFALLVVFSSSPKSYDPEKPNMYSKNRIFELLLLLLFLFLLFLLLSFCLFCLFCDCDCD